MTDFQDAINIAIENAKELLNQATNFAVEEALLSDDDKRYEVTLSYDLKGRDPLSGDNAKNNIKETGILQLARLMSYRKEYKTFLVDKRTGNFKGFKIKKQA
ncbi:hypothetical protein [Xanthomonas cannabis]|uniref:hypothetical protein n=1 Tax=Xanthomonas cannabis TaxID=1885674 RepID=UPI0033BF5938